MRKSDIGPAAIVVLGLVPLVLWLATNPASAEHPAMNHRAQRLGEIFATTALALMACGLALAARAPWLEVVFGGLDRLSAAHKRTALTALTVPLAYLVSIPKHDFFTPGSYMGLVALLGRRGLALLTLAPSPAAGLLRPAPALSPAEAHAPIHRRVLSARPAALVQRRTPHAKLRPSSTCAGRCP